MYGHGRYFGMGVITGEYGMYICMYVCISMCSDFLAWKSLPKSFAKVKQLVQKVNNQLRFEHAKSCVVQGEIFRLPSFENDDTWGLTVMPFSDSVFLSLNARQDTVPHKANLV